MKARVKATGEIWEFSQIDEITFKSAINGHLYCAEELEFLEPSVFTPDYWIRLEHQAMIAVMQGMLSNPNLANKDSSPEIICNHVAERVKEIAHALVEKAKHKEE